MSDIESSGVTVAHRILAQLADLGVEVIFGLPGVHNLAFWAATGPGLPRIIGVRHEQTAVYAADGYARATGRIGVALTTTGPGAANAVAAFGEAYSCFSPVLLIASEPPMGRGRVTGHDTGLLHAMPDQTALFSAPFNAFTMALRGVVQASHLVPSVVSALLGLPAPGYVGIPADVLAAPADDHQADLPDLWERRPDLAPAIPEPADVAALARLLAGRRVVLWAGHEVVTGGCADLLASTAERLGAPVITTLGAHGVLGDHASAVNAPAHEPEVASLLATADVLLVVGDPLHAMATQGWSMPVPATIAAITRYAGQSMGDYDLALRLETEVGVTLSMLLPLLVTQQPWAPTGIRTAVLDRIARDDRTEAAVRFVRAIDAGWPNEAVIISDMCIPGYWVTNYCLPRRARRLQHPLGWGTLGYGLPAAIGSAAAGLTTLAIVGDGGAAMGIGELATYAQEQLPVVLLLVDDGGYGMLRYDQYVAGTPDRGVDLLGPHWPSLVKAFGLTCIAISHVDELQSALRKAHDDIASTGPVVLYLRAALFPPRTTSPRWADGTP